MRTVITGGAGFVGSHLCERFLAEGHEVVCVDNLLTGLERNIAHLRDHPRFAFLLHNISEPLHIDGIVLCETAWVLRTAYGLARGDVADALERILDTRQFAIEDRDSARQALDAFAEGRGDFADYLIGVARKGG